MADIKDAEDILSIYEPYILNSVITFEYDKIPVSVFKERMKKIMSQFPWLVCHVDGKLAGYAYCSPHYERAAFAWDCECTVYLSEEYKRRGIASALYHALFELVQMQGYYNIYALICDSNESSIYLHLQQGFKKMGTYYNTGFKLGEWRNLMVLEKTLRPFTGTPKAVISINKIENSEISKVIRNAEILLIK
jgi:phosphinothricin acetyltransferase